MFDTIRRSFRLVKVCLHVLAVDKELVLFPIFSSIGVVLVLLTFVGVGVGSGAFNRIGAADLVVVFAFYVLAYFIIIFFNSALVFAAHERLAGGDPNIRSGLEGASRRIGTILVWALIAATVGLILNILSNQARERGGVTGFISEIIISLLGAAWTLTTYFIVPLMVIEQRPLGDAFKTSLSMLRRTWGEQVVAGFGLGLVALVAYIAAGAVTVLLLIILSSLGAVGIITAVVIGVVLFASVFLILTTVEGIYKAALYNYATNGEVPSLFPDDVIRGAFRARDREIVRDF